jgi:hypothetical protein
MRRLLASASILLMGSLPACDEGVLGRVASAPGSRAEAPVFLVLVEDAAAVARVRGSVAPERIVAASETALALEGGKVVAAGGDGLDEVLRGAGWTGRSLEIWSPGGAGGAASASAPAAAGAPPASGPASVPGRDLNSLAKKSTLTPGEALAALQQLQ